MGNYLEQHTLPSVDVLARYDVLVIDNEWAHRSPEVFAQIRAKNPDIKILAYICWVDRTDNFASPTNGPWWSNRDQYLAQIPEQWLAKRANGSYVSEWPGSTMINLTDRAPLVNGRQAWRFAADWTVDHIWATGKWDGIMLDVWGDRIWNNDAQSWDVDRNGSDESGSALYGDGSPWQRGIDASEKVMRLRMGPGAILVANNTRNLVAGQLSGRMFEDFDEIDFLGRQWGWDTPGSINAATDPNAASSKITLNVNHRLPGVTGALGSNDLRRARYFLTSTLLGNAYWGGTGQDYNELPYYDEYDGAGKLGTKYLGAPEVANPNWGDVDRPFVDGSGKYPNGVYRRDFAGGIALTNPTGSSQTVTLERPYRKLQGVQDPKTNDGSLATQVSVPSHDGLVLVSIATGSSPPAPPSLALPAPSPLPSPTQVVTRPPLETVSAPIATPLLATIPGPPDATTGIAAPPLVPQIIGPARGLEEVLPTRVVSPQPATRSTPNTRATKTRRVRPRPIRSTRKPRKR